MNTPVPPPSHIGRYRIERELGRGAMGVVYEAEDTALGRMVALKTFATATAVAPNEREAFEQRFLNEARIAATIEDRNVVAVYDVGRDSESGLLFMALEYVRGETLADALSRGPMPWPEAVRIVAKVARALETAHSQQIVHRDIKPANIMISTNGEPKVMDFGIARAATSHLTLAGQVFGTPSYMSPEQASGDKVDARSDIFSLGTVLYELVTDTRAFEGSSVSATLTKILRDEPARASSRAAVPEAVDAIISKALLKAREERYQSAAQLAADLESLVGGPVKAGGPEALSRTQTLMIGSQEVSRETVVLKPGSARRAESRRPSRSRLLPVIGAIVVLVLAVVLWRGSSQPEVTLDPEMESWAKRAREAAAQGDSAAALEALERVTKSDPTSATAAELTKELNLAFSTSAIAAQAEMAQARALAEGEAGTSEDPAFDEAETLAASAAESLHSGQFVMATQRFIGASAAYDRARRTLLVPPEGPAQMEGAPETLEPARVVAEARGPTEPRASGAHPQETTLPASTPLPVEALKMFVPGRTEISGASPQAFRGGIEFEATPNPLRLGTAFRIQIFLKSEGKDRVRLRTFAVRITRNGETSIRAEPLLKDVVKGGERALLAEIPARSSGQRLVSTGIENWVMDVEAVLAGGEQVRASLTMKPAPE